MEEEWTQELSMSAGPYTDWAEMNPEEIW